MVIERTIRKSSLAPGFVSAEEARSYYDTHLEEYAAPDLVKARQIVVASERAANKILRALKEGADFERLATERSLGPEARFGGNLGYFARGDMPEAFNIVFSMEKGEISESVKSPYGFHILKVEDRTASRQLTFEEVAEDVKKKLTQTKAEQRYYQWLEELRRNAKTEINHDLLEYTD
jgi:parvulin-like peptidyl-prolyl isomerase